MEECPHPYPIPETLKDCIEFICWLNAKNLVNTVVEDLRIRLSSIIDDTNITANLKTAISDICVLRETLLTSSNFNTKYDHYEVTDGCQKHFATALVICLSKMFPPLLFLWFNANDQTGSVKGTKWKDQYCYGYTGNLDLHNWLTDSSGGHGFIRRGMTYANLATIKGLPLSQKLGIKYLTEGGSLQKALYGLIFLTPGWYREHTANAMLFLEEICEYIFYGKINVSSCSWLKEPEQFDAVCKSLYGKLTWLNGSGIFNSTETPPTLGAVYNYSPNYTNNMYHSKLKPENFKLYISWLTDNLQHIINALKEMENSARSWTPNGLESAQNTGPFPYGFLFRDTNWESNKYTFCTEINDIIEGPSGLRALAALCYRSQCSNNFLCSVESSSVIGTSVLGGAIGCTLAYVHFYVPGGIVGLF